VAADAAGTDRDDVVLTPVALATVAPGTQVTRSTRKPLNRRGRATLKLHLNATGRRLLKESGRLTIRVQVDVRDRTGWPSTLQKVIDVLRKRR
jgi:hypothetical protein